MTFALRYEFRGLCREAMDFYCEALHFTIDKLVTYGECENIGIPIKPEHKDLIYQGVLVHPSGCRLIVCDSFGMLLSQDPVIEMNEGHLSQKGCITGAAFEIENLTEDEITAMYHQLIENHAIVHTPLGKRGNFKLFASVMDRFNVSWNLSCE